MKCGVKSGKGFQRSRSRFWGWALAAFFCFVLFMGKRNMERSGGISLTDPSGAEAVSIQEEIDQGGIPLLLQTDRRWAKIAYGNGRIEDKGCGPTCLSMVAAGLLQNALYTPVYLAEKSEEWGYVEQENGTSWQLMTQGAEKLGLISEEIPLDEGRMAGELSAGRPLICAMGPGEFTTEGHFIVLVSYSEEGFALHDPNSRKRSEKVYHYEELAGQIRNLWSFHKADS